ncbi:MAG: hypothetical protein A3K65_09665 [Euryarchaeota archaeon RBG_16_68_12]|nr:MAG: hypothetical protein A3K65_09665 [Euryarchaeota archaeon RBG_16_68_12]
MGPPLRRTAIMRSRPWASALALAGGLALIALLAAPAAGYGERVFNADRTTSGLTYPVSSTASAASTRTAPPRA